jgi:hypothetical protein
MRLAAEPPLPLATALAGQRLIVEANGDGREHLALTLRNPSPGVVSVAIPAGLIAASTTGERRVVLRGAEAGVPARGAVEVALPAAALSSKSRAASASFTLTDATEPRLAPLLKYLTGQPEAPRATAQLAVFCLLENISFAGWLRFLSASAPDESHPTPAEVAQAIDALGILRTVAPEQAFALQSDSDLKLRALRNPWCRAKAMQLYGLQIGDGALPPDIGQLLHTKPGDNCPVCRQRTLLQQPGGDL